MDHPIARLTFSADGKLLASGGDVGADGVVVKLWDFATHKPVATLKGHKGPVLGISFSRTARLLRPAQAGDGRGLKKWSLTNGVYQLLLNLGKADSLCSSPDGKTLVTSREAEIRLWMQPHGNCETRSKDISDPLVECRS